jgi:ribonuclease E
MESHTHQDAGRTAAEGDDRRERRSRDRYGRDRRERGERQPRDASALPTAAEGISGIESGDDVQARPRYPTGFVSEEAVEPQPQAVPAVPAAEAPATVQAPVSTSAALPKVQPFELPVAELAQVAAGCGLQWVNSDAQKIAAVQAAIAAEPKPVRIPRERPPMIVIDEGPLVLVETRRDLHEMKLPFEQASLPL